MALPTEPRERLREYAGEFGELIRMGATKEQLLNGANGKHGLNHVVEAWNMLKGEGQGSEFRIRE